MNLQLGFPRKMTQDKMGGLHGLDALLYTCVSLYEGAYCQQFKMKSNSE